MNILLLGGTGAIGKALTEKLRINSNTDIAITSRKKKKSTFKNVKYIEGNALDKAFTLQLLKEKWDVIVDFMIYDSSAFAEQSQLYLNSGAHYIFFSSARVYAESSEPIQENSARLLDICKDADYLLSDEYALKKAREEDILFRSGKSNFTIIRPYITCNSNRIQLGVYEKELWLYRALEGRTVYFPGNMRDKLTTITYAEDLAVYLAKLIEINTPSGDVFHIATGECLCWEELIHIYREEIYRITKKKIKVEFIENADNISRILGNGTQIKYDRIYNRRFDNSKIREFTGIEVFTDTKCMVKKILNDFLRNPCFGDINWAYEGYLDKLSGEMAKCTEIKECKQRIIYFIFRLFPLKCSIMIRKILGKKHV